MKETRERARVQSLTAWLKPGAEPAHTVDWLENVDRNGQVWSGTLIEDEDTKTRIIGGGADAIRLSSNRGGVSVRQAALEMNIGGVPLHLCTAGAEVLVELEFASELTRVTRMVDTVSQLLERVS